MGQRGTAVLLLALGHLAGLLASGTACANIYQGFSDCVLKLGKNMATYREVDGIKLQELHRICGYQDMHRSKETAIQRAFAKLFLVLPKSLFPLKGFYLYRLIPSRQMEMYLMRTQYWDEFHMCALAALWECQKEAVAIWEMLRRESRKIEFQGSLFDLCSPSTAQSFAWTHIPNISILGIPLIVTWLNL